MNIEEREAIKLAEKKISAARSFPDVSTIFKDHRTDGDFKRRPYSMGTLTCLSTYLWASEIIVAIGIDILPIAQSVLPVGATYIDLSIPINTGSIFCSLVKDNEESKIKKQREFLTIECGRCATCCSVPVVPVTCSDVRRSVKPGLPARKNRFYNERKWSMILRRTCG